MCNSQAEGGQRCHGHALTAMNAAENLTLNAARANAASPNFTPETHDNLQRARYALGDARARYASTPQGATDLAARMDALTILGHAPDWATDGDTQYRGYALALSEGTRLRARAKDLHDAVKAGILTGPQASELAAYPTAHAIVLREAVITRALTCKNGDVTAAERGSAEAGPVQPLRTPSSTCSACGGAGEIFINHSRDNDPQQDDTRPCVNCDGTGQHTPTARGIR